MTTLHPNIRRPAKSDSQHTSAAVPAEQTTSTTSLPGLPLFLQRMPAVEHQRDEREADHTAERITKKDVAFRQAAVKDGVAVTTTEITDTSGAKQKLTLLKGGVSEYANTNWTELYAESFAFYTTDPTLLKLIRPNIYAYFAKKFPRTKTP